MKKLCLIVLLVSSFFIEAQTKIKYQRWQNVTTAQRDAIDVSDTSVTYEVYNITTNQKEHYNSVLGSWVAGGGASAASAITANSYATITATNVQDWLEDLKDELDALAIGAGAVTSVNGKAGTVVLDPDDLDDSSTTNKFTNTTEKATWNAKQNALIADTDYLTPSTAGLTYFPIWDYDYSDLINKPTIVNGLLQSVTNPLDVYFGTKLRPITANDGFYTTSANDKWTGYLGNITGTGVNVIGGFSIINNSAPFVNETSLLHYGTNYHQVALRNNGSLYFTNDLFITGGKNTSDIIFQLGNTGTATNVTSSQDNVFQLNADRSVLFPMLTNTIINSSSSFSAVNKGFLQTYYAPISHSHALSGLSDITFSGLATNDLLRWNGTNWVNSTAASLNLINRTATNYMVSGSILDFQVGSILRTFSVPQFWNGAQIGTTFFDIVESAGNDNYVLKYDYANQKIALEPETGGGGTDDQTAAEVPFTPYSTIGSTNTQLALEELKDELDAAIIGVGTGATPSTRTASGGETNWNVGTAITTQGKLFVNGIKLTEGVDYTKSGSTFTFTGYTSVAGHKQEYYPDIAVPSSGGGDVSKVGTPANNQVGVWTGDTTLEGQNSFTWNSATSIMNLYGDGGADDAMYFHVNDTEMFKFAQGNDFIETIRPFRTLSGITSSSFIKSGGNSAQFLKADGSSDNNVYITTIPVTDVSGKTLKSTLAGTEEVLINDAGTLKKTTAQDIANLGGGGGTPDMASAIADIHLKNVTQNMQWFLPAITSSNYQTYRTSSSLVQSGQNAEYDYPLRVRYSTTTTAGNTAFQRGSPMTVEMTNEFHFMRTFQIQSNITDTRFFVGITPNYQLSDPSNIDPTTQTECIGVTKIAGSQNLHAIHNDASGTATTIDLGSSYPANNTTPYTYKLEVYGKKSVGMTIKLTRIDSTGTEISTTQSISTDMPDYGSPVIWITNNATAAAASIADLECITMQKTY